MSWKDVMDNIIAIVLAIASIVFAFWFTAVITVLARLVHAMTL